MPLVCSSLSIEWEIDTLIPCGDRLSLSLSLSLSLLILDDRCSFLSSTCIFVIAASRKRVIRVTRRRHLPGST